MRYFILPVVALIFGAAIQGASASCADLPSRKLLQASSNANVAAIDNLSGQVTNQTASANAQASAVSSSIVPLPRK